MCEQASLMFPRGVREESKILVPTPEVANVTNSLPTNDHVRGNELLDHKQMIVNLNEGLQIYKMRSDAGFIQTVATGQYFMTIDDAELERSEGPIACREYALPRNKE